MASWLPALIGAVVPALAGKLFGGDSQPTTPSNVTPAMTADQAELLKMATDRVKQSQPLYESVMKMAMGRLPVAYQTGTPAAGGASGAPKATLTTPEFNAGDTGMPDFAKQAIADHAMPGSVPSGSAFTPAMSMPQYVDIINTSTGEMRRGIPADQIPQGWIRIGAPRLNGGSGSI